MNATAISSLTGAAIDVLGQLFCNGPTWDGNVVSKSGRDELVEHGLCVRWNGWQQLTVEGLELAAAANVRDRANQWWFRKQNQLWPERRYGTIT